MSQRSIARIARDHAVYLPQASLPRPAARSHAEPIEKSPEHKPAPRPRPKAAPSSPQARRGAETTPRGLLGALCPAAVLLCALGLTFVGLVHGLFFMLQRTLLGGTLLILLREHVGLQSYGTLRKRIGLVTGHWSDHALLSLYLLAMFFATAIVATLLAWGASLLIGVLLG